MIKPRSFRFAALAPLLALVLADRAPAQGWWDGGTYEEITLNVLNTDGEPMPKQQEFALESGRFEATGKKTSWTGLPLAVSLRPCFDAEFGYIRTAILTAFPELNMDGFVAYDPVSYWLDPQPPNELPLMVIPGDKFNATLQLPLAGSFPNANTVRSVYQPIVPLAGDPPAQQVSTRRWFGKPSTWVTYGGSSMISIWEPRLNDRFSPSLDAKTTFNFSALLNLAIEAQIGNADKARSFHLDECLDTGMTWQQAALLYCGLQMKAQAVGLAADGAVASQNETQTDGLVQLGVFKLPKLSTSKESIVIFTTHGYAGPAWSTINLTCPITVPLVKTQPTIVPLRCVVLPTILTIRDAGNHVWPLAVDYGPGGLYTVTVPASATVGQAKVVGVESPLSQKNFAINDPLSVCTISN